MSCVYINAATVYMVIALSILEHLQKMRKSPKKCLALTVTFLFLNDRFYTRSFLDIYAAAIKLYAGEINYLASKQTFFVCLSLFMETYTPLKTVQHFCPLHPFWTTFTYSHPL